MNRFAIESPAHGDALAQMSGSRLLRLKAVHDAVGVVVERQLRARRGSETLRGLVERLVRVATAVHNGARPCPGIVPAGLLCHNESGKRHNGGEKKEESPGHTFEPSTADCTTPASRAAV